MLQLFSSANQVSFDSNTIEYKFKTVDADGQPFGEKKVRAEWKYRVASLRGYDTYGSTLPRDPIGSRSESNDMLKENLNHSISIRLNNTNNSHSIISFTAKDNPTVINHIPSGLNYTDYDDYLSDISNIIGNHPALVDRIKTYLSFDQDDNISMFVEAKVDTIESIEISHNVQHIGFLPLPFIIYYHEPIADNTPENYEVRFEVFFDGKKIACLTDTPDTEGFSSFQINQILKQYFEEQDPVKDYSNKDIKIAFNKAIITVRYSEYYEDIASESWTSESFKLIKGGIDIHFENAGWTYESITEDNNILSNQPPERLLTFNQPVFIPILSLEDATYSYQMVWTNRDGTTGFYHHNTSQFIEAFDTLLIPINYEELDENVAELKVKVIKNADFDYKEFRFVFDSICYDYETQICALNQFGIPEFFRLTGKLKTSIEMDRNSYLYRGSFDRTKQLNVDWNWEYTLRTGYMREAELEALIEVLTLNKITWEGYELFIETDSFDITESWQELHALQFKAIRSITPVNFAKFGSKIIELNKAWEHLDDTNWEYQDGTNWEY